MKITFLGAAKTVTGSQHLIEVNGLRILLDCGLFQGKRKEAFKLNRQQTSLDNLDAIILSHAHIDHSGNIPCRVRNGFEGDIICTSATRDLCSVMLMDSAYLQSREVEFVNRRRKKEGKVLFEPLYTKEDVVSTMSLFLGMSYNQRRQIFPGIELTLVDAGHMLGSAHVVLDIEDNETKKQTRVVFSGDIGRPGIPIIRDPQPIVEGADVLIIESTYGNRSHPPYPESEKELKRIVNETHERGGTLLIPAFSVGRTQQIVYTLHRLFENNEIPAMPIYVDSPLATRATDIFRLHPETYDTEIRDFLLQDRENNPFGFSTMRYVESVEDSKELCASKEPAVVISASGMMEGGRILHHLKSRISNPNTTILITGWQSPYTLGRRIVDGNETVKIFGEEHKLKAKVEIITGFSGHADREGLLAWTGAMQKKPQQTFVVHGVWAKVSVAEEAMKTQRVVAGSIRFDDPAALAEARRLEVARMGKILAGLDRTAYEEMLIPSRWYRIYRTLESEVEGESGEIAEVAYYRIEERVGMLGEVNQAASSAMFTADERTEGLLVTLMSRYLLLGDGSTYIDVESTAWMSFDRTRERWSIRSATYVNDPNISEFLLAGRRTMTGDRRGDVIQIVRDFPPTPAETAQLRVPKESYLNHAEQYLLYRMIPRSEALTYGLYLYEPRLGRMAYRTESIRPGLVPESDSKRQKDADAHLVRLTNEGTIARLEMVNGDVTLPIKPSDLLAIWREKNLPTGKGSQKAAPPLLLEQMLEKKEMRMEKEEEETGGGRTNSGKRRR